MTVKLQFNTIVCVCAMGIVSAIGIVSGKQMESRTPLSAQKLHNTNTKFLGHKLLQIFIPLNMGYLCPNGQTHIHLFVNYQVTLNMPSLHKCL